MPEDSTNVDQSGYLIVVDTVQFSHFMRFLAPPITSCVLYDYKMRNAGVARACVFPLFRLMFTSSPAIKFHARQILQHHRMHFDLEPPALHHRVLLSNLLHFLD